jgi:hypothetical protein
MGMRVKKIVITLTAAAALLAGMAQAFGAFAAPGMKYHSAHVRADAVTPDMKYHS